MEAIKKQVEEIEQTQQPAEESPRQALARVVEEVAEDARQAPQAYLEESLVPEGGE